MHWTIRPKQLFQIAHWTRGLSIALPRTGAAAQVYYRTSSSSAVVLALTEALQPGDAMLDIGAHVGEYSLLAAAAVGVRGRVIAVEPQQHLADVIRQNAFRNGLRNIEVKTKAVSARRGEVALSVDTASGGAWLRTDTTVGASVECTTLDDLVQEIDRAVTFAKIDAAGNELSVFDGGARTLAQAMAPRFVYKLYSRQVAADRFGIDPLRCVELLSDSGYAQWLLIGGARVPIASATDVLASLDHEWYSLPVLAMKKAAR